MPSTKNKKNNAPRDFMILVVLLLTIPGYAYPEYVARQVDSPNGLTVEQEKQFLEGARRGIKDAWAHVPPALYPGLFGAGYRAARRDVEGLTGNAAIPPAT